MLSHRCSIHQLPYYMIDEELLVPHSKHYLLCHLVFHLV
eukprot:Gb_31886 [translate_table: standard]